MSDLVERHDASTFELGDVRLRLRDGLQFSVQRGRQHVSYLMEDKSSGQFFRVGEAEYAFLSLLDGKTTMATAMAMTCSLLGRDAFSEQECAQLCKWLVDSGLAMTKASTSSQRQSKRRVEQSRVALQQWLNPISVRVPLGNPQWIVEKISPWTQWIYCLPMALVWVLICAWAGLSFAARSEPFLQAGLDVFSRDTWLWFGVTWLALKLIHELSHALACHRFGGEVRGFGILFLLLIPLPFVDVTSAWRLSNKYHRILISAAGMISEVFLAAIATLIWVRVDPGIVRQICSSVMLAAGVNTLVFNLNPLMKFDGYHMLADWLELPNLAKHGQQYLNGLGRKYFLGLPAHAIPWAGRRGVIVRAYGVGAFVWRILVCVALILGAANLSPGIGFVIACVAVLLWAAIPTLRLIRFLLSGNEFEQPNRKRFAKVIGIGAAAVVVIATVIPAPTVITAPVTIDYAPKSIVRSKTAGFVDRVHVKSNQLVRAGATIITLTNDELQSRRAQLAVDLEAAKLRASGLGVNRRDAESVVAQWQIAQESVLALEKQLGQIDEEVAMLTVRAPFDGEILLVDESSLPGRFISEGEKLFSMGNPDEKQAIALVHQADGHALEYVLGAPTSVRVWGYPKLITGTIEKVSPRVRNQLPHFAFAGMYGGPLEVVDRRHYEEASAEPTVGSEPDLSEILLLESRYAMQVELPRSASRRLFSGQTGLMHLRAREQSLGTYAILGAIRWFSQRVQTTHGL